MEPTIYKQPSIYKSSLSLSDIEKMSIWVDVTDKLGEKITGFDFSRVNIYYNKLVGMVRVRGYSSKSSGMTGVTTTFEFNNDLPNYLSNGPFALSGVAYGFSQYPCLCRANPYGPQSNINGFISVQNSEGTVYSFEYDLFTTVYAAVKKEFEEYLGI